MPVWIWAKVCPATAAPLAVARLGTTVAKTPAAAARIHLWFRGAAATDTERAGKGRSFALSSQHALNWDVQDGSTREKLNEPQASRLFVGTDPTTISAAMFFCHGHHVSIILLEDLAGAADNSKEGMHDVMLVLGR